MKKKILIIVFVIYGTIALLATKFLLDRNEYGVFETKNNYYICNETIKEYDGSSLVQFDKNIDSEKLVEEDVYYFNIVNELQSGKLVSYDKEKELFNIDGVDYDKDKVLGRPNKAYQLVGSLLNIVTSRAFYLIFVIIPFLGLLIYEIYLFTKYSSHEKNKKGVDNDKKTEEKDK